jgi:hypothetical protein
MHRRFEIRDSIEMAWFAEPGLGSPDGRYIATLTQRGRLAQNVTEGTIWLSLERDAATADAGNNCLRPTDRWWAAESVGFGSVHRASQAVVVDVLDFRAEFHTWLETLAPNDLHTRQLRAELLATALTALMRSTA